MNSGIFKSAVGKDLVVGLLISMLSLSSYIGFSQEDSWNVDSLYHEINVSTDSALVDVYTKIASYYGGIEDSVVLYTDLAYALANEIGFEHGKANSLIIKGGMYHLSGNNDIALELYNQALDIYLKLGNDRLVGECLNSMGMSLVAESRYGEALRAYNRVSEFSDSSQIAKSYKNIGILISDTGDPSQAMEYFLKSIDISKRHNNEREVAFNYLGMAIVTITQNDLDRAFEYFNKARVIYEKLGNRLGIANCHNNIGLIYLNQGEYNKSINEYKASLEIYERLNINHGKAVVNMNIGKTLFELGDYLAAEEYYLKAKGISDLMNNKNLESNVLEFGAQVLYEKGELQASLSLLERGLQLAKELNHWGQMVDISADLVEIYRKEGAYKKALEYKDLFTNSKDSLMSVEESKEIERLNFSHDLSNIENELALQKTEVALLEKEQQNARLIYGLIIAGSALLIVFAGFSFFRQRKINRIQKRAMESEKAYMKISLEQEKLKRNQLNEVIVYKNKQLTDLAIHITEKNDLLERFKENIKSVKKSVQGKKVTGLLQDMLVNISQDIDMNKERLEFYKEIEDLNQTFLYTMSKKYPALSDRELKLAALLRVNLATKRIAVLMGLSPISVDIYRHNLRKKIGLEKGISLYDFFNKLED